MPPWNATVEEGELLPWPHPLCILSRLLAPRSCASEVLRISMQTTTSWAHLPRAVMTRYHDGREVLLTHVQRFNDGEVVRYGAGESWRPTPRRGGNERDRSPPRRPRSPVRDRDRSRPRSPRHRSPIVPGSDSYVPGRYAPRRRSQSRGPPLRADTYRRERSRDRESPRRRERTRSPVRRSPGPRRSLSRRGTPRRISPGRGDRYERPRSPPRRDWERERERDFDRERVREREVDRIRDRELEWRDRERSRERERERDLERRDDRRDERWVHQNATESLFQD
jgi:hypothetical protein